MSLIPFNDKKLLIKQQQEGSHGQWHGTAVMTMNVHIFVLTLPYLFTFSRHDQRRPLIAIGDAALTHNHTLLNP